VNGDGVSDLKLQLRYAFAPSSPARDAKLDKICASIRPGFDRTPTERFMPKETRATLEFVLSGQTLAPTPATAKWVATLAQQQL
jgi:hypothetical protein